MAKLVDPSSMKPVIIPCPNCIENVSLQPERPVLYEDKITDLEAMIQAKVRDQEERLDEKDLQAAISLHRRNASNKDWERANLDRKYWELKFQYMGLDEILDRAERNNK